MVRIEAPQQDRLQHAQHHCGQMGTPHAARTIIDSIGTVNIRLTHPKMLAQEHRAIIALGVMRPHAPATLDAVSAPVGEASSSPTLLASLG